MEPTKKISELYTGMYAHGVNRAWRDAGAVDKVDNIIRAYCSAGLPPRPRVVELGCGEGALAAELALRGFTGSYLGLDMSESGIGEARNRAVPGADFRVATGGAVPVPDGSADLVVLSHVVEHLEHPRILLYEARRIAPHVIVEVPLELNIRMPRDYEVDDLGHINKYSAASIRQLVQSCDFEVLDQFTTNPPHALFGVTSRKRHLQWQLKEVGLKVATPLARALFTFHETLFLRSPRHEREPADDSVNGGKIS